MTNEKLQQLKEHYLETKPDAYQVDALWQELSDKLPDNRENPRVFRVSFAVATLFLAISLGISLNMVSAAQPNSALYPVKLMTDTFTAKITGNYDDVIEKRTEDIMKAAKRRSPSDVEKAADAYTKSLHEVKTASPSSDSKERIRESLKESNHKLRMITPVHPNSRPVIENAIKSTEQAVQEVKGAKNTQGPQTGQENRNQGNPDGDKENSGGNQSHQEEKGNKN